MFIRIADKVLSLPQTNKLAGYVGFQTANQIRKKIQIQTDDATAMSNKKQTDCGSFVIDFKIKFLSHQ